MKRPRVREAPFLGPHLPARVSQRSSSSSSADRAASNALRAPSSRRVLPSHPRGSGRRPFRRSVCHEGEVFPSHPASLGRDLLLRPAPSPLKLPRSGFVQQRAPAVTRMPSSADPVESVTTSSVTQDTQPEPEPVGKRRAVGTRCYTPAEIFRPQPFGHHFSCGVRPTFTSFSGAQVATSGGRAYLLCRPSCPIHSTKGVSPRCVDATRAFVVAAGQPEGPGRLAVTRAFRHCWPLIRYCFGPASVNVRTANHSGAARTLPESGVTVSRPQYWPFGAVFNVLTVTDSVADCPAARLTELGETLAPANPAAGATVIAAAAL